MLKLIIQCPSCKTKFSISTELLNSTNVPKFHCSRCDHLFHITEQADPILKPPKQLDLLDESGTEKETLHIEPNQNKAISEEQPAAHDSLITNEKLANSDKISISWPEENSSCKPHKADFSAEHSTFKETKKKAAVVPLKKRSEEVKINPTTPDLSTFAQDFDLNFDDEAIEEHEENSVENLKSKNSFIPKISRLPSIVRFSAPPLVICLSLSMFSGILESSPILSKAIYEIAESKYPSPPPSSLKIAKVKTANVALDNGNQVLEVTGELVNNSQRALQEIKVQVSLYDDLNKKRTTIVSSADNGLKRLSRLESLNNEMIEELQSKKLPGEHKLESTKTTPFRVAFTDIPKEASKYSVRVFSVKAVKS